MTAIVRTLTSCASLLLFACQPVAPGAQPSATKADPLATPAMAPVATAPIAAAPIAAPPAVTPPKAKPAHKEQLPALASGERRKLEEQVEPAKRQAFWAAIQQGRKLTASKDYPGAIASFDAALLQIPEHPRALSGRGYAQLLAGQLDAAETDLRKALAAPGTAKIESAIEFNLGLVAEKRGDLVGARQRFAIANTLRPSKAAADKLVGATSCPAVVQYEDSSELYADFMELWERLVKDEVIAAEPRPADEKAARAAVCKSVAVNGDDRASPDACTGPEPWLVTHEGDWQWLHYAIETADAGQWRVYEIGSGGYPHCGQRDKLTVSRGEVTVIHRVTGVGTVLDVMEGKDGEIVDCEGDADCFTACGEDEVEVVDYLLSPRNPDAIAIFRSELASVNVVVNGGTVRLQGGGCDQEVGLVKPD